MKDWLYKKREIFSKIKYSHKIILDYINQTREELILKLHFVLYQEPAFDQNIYCYVWYYKSFCYILISIILLRWS